MSKLYKMIGQQFANPHGVIGKICCRIMNRKNRKMYKAVAQQLSADKSTVVLDVGYGNGYLIQTLYRQYKCNLYGIELSAELAKWATSRNKTGIDDGKIRLLNADCCDMPFVSEMFDYVTTVNTIYFWEDTELGLSEIHRVLKDGGVFCNAVYTQEWLQKQKYTREGFKFFDQDEYINMGKQVGFKEVTIKPIRQGKNFLVIYKK